MDSKIQNSIDICNKYTAKMSLLGGCDLIFGVCKLEGEDRYGKIYLLHTLKKKYDTIIIPDFVNGIGSECSNFPDYMIECTDHNKHEIYEYYNNMMSGSDVDTVILGKNTSSISFHAFVSSNVRKVIVNNALNNIDDDSFLNCRDLEHINLEDMKVGSRIGSSAFLHCHKLVKVDLRKVKELGSHAFNNCTSLKKVELPEFESFKKLNDRLFMECNELEEIYIPDNIEEISDTVFYKDEKLKKIRLGKNIKFLDRFSFALGDDSTHDKESSKTILIENEYLGRIRVNKSAFNNINNLKIIHNGKELGYSDLNVIE